MNKPLLIILLLGIAVISSGCIEIGTGSSTDTIYGIEHNGFIWKTYSVWLTNDHPTKDYSAIYTVSENDKATIEKLQKAYASHKTVKVYYRNELAYFPPWEYTSNAVAIIYNVEELN